MSVSTERKPETSETVTGKKLDPKYEAYVHGAGMVLLLGLMAVIMFNDILKIFR